MLIILEGPDCAGKTTLARHIAHTIQHQLHEDVNVFSAGPPKDHPLTEYETPLLDYRPGTKHHIVCDRWHVGEAVYPGVLGRTTQWDRAVSRHIEAFLAARGAVIVFLNPPVSVMTEWINERGDDLINAGQLEAIAKSYQRIMPSLTHLVPNIHYRLTPGEADVSIILGMARAQERATAALGQFITYVGPKSPRILLFGENRNNPPFELSPAFQPYPATSGHFLLRHLDVSSEHIGMANACDVDDAAALWRLLGNPSAVALGNAAHNKLNLLGVKHVTVPHPQFIRRFHHRSGLAYAEVIMEAGTTERSMAAWRP